MNITNISEINQYELTQINGGQLQEAYDTGKAAGEVAGEFVGRMINDFLKLSGIWKVISLF